MSNSYDNYWRQVKENPQPARNDIPKKFDYIGLAGLLVSVVNGFFLCFMTFWAILEDISRYQVSDSIKILLWVSELFMLALWAGLVIGLFLPKRMAMGLSVAAIAVAFADLIYNTFLIVVVH